MMMMSTAEKDAVICEETSITLYGADASCTDTECAREAISVETEEELASFYGNEESCEDTVMVDKQNGSAEQKEELCASNKNKSEEAHNPSVALLKKGMSSTDEAVEEGIEVDTPSSSKEICAVGETVEERTETDKGNVAPSKNEMNTSEEAVEKNAEIQNLSAAPSKEEVSVTDEAVEECTEAQSLIEVATTEEAIEEWTEAQSSSEVTTTEEAIEEWTEAQSASEVTTTEGAVEEWTEAQSSSEVTTTEEAIEEWTEAQSASDVTTTEGAVEEWTEAQSSSEVATTEEATEEWTEAQSLIEVATTEKTIEEWTEAQSLIEVATTEEAIEEWTEAQSLIEVATTEEAMEEWAAQSLSEVATTEEAIEKKTEAQNLGTTESTTEEAVEKPTETQNLSASPLKKEISSTNEAAEKMTEDQNLSAELSNKEVSNIEDAVEKTSEIQNLSAVLSNKEDSATEEATEKRLKTQNLNAALSTEEMSTTEEALEKWKETPNVSAPTLKKEVSSTNEAGEQKTEGQHLNVAPSNKEAATTKEAVKKKTKAQKLVALPSMKGKILKAAVKKRTECQNVGLALTNRKMSTPEETVEEEKTDDAGVCGPSKKVCTAFKAEEENIEEPKASTSASCSRSDPDISVLRNIPRNSNLVRGRLSLHSRRALMNRQARRSQGIHFAFNGKIIAPKRPRVSVPRVHVTAEAFPSLASELYSLLPESFKEAVSLSMMEYYMMILYHHRLAGLRMNRRAPLPKDETLCSNLELGPLFVPEVFEQWITMRGHDVNTRGETIRLILPPLPSDTGDFGRVSATTHWRYISDLAPRIFRDRIAADLQHTLLSGPVEWDLHEDIRPREKNCGLPTRNLLGYHVAQKLTSTQIDELHLCGIGVWNDKAVFPVHIDAECYHLNVHLVRAVSQHFATLGMQFRIVRHAQYDSQPSSAGLIVYGERMISENEEYLFDRNAGHYEHKAKVRAYAPVAMDKELAKGAVVFLPRVYRRDGKRPIVRSWCAYDFGFYFMVPDEWTATRNNAYKQGTWQSWHTPHLTTASVTRADLLKVVVKRSILSQEQTS